MTEQVAGTFDPYNVNEAKVIRPQWGYFMKNKPKCVILRNGSFFFKGFNQWLSRILRHTAWFTRAPSSVKQ